MSEFRQTPIYDALGLADELAAFEADWQAQRRRFVRSMPRARYAAALVARTRDVVTVNGDRGPIGGRVTVTANAAGEQVEMTREQVLEAMHEVVATLTRTPRCASSHAGRPCEVCDESEQRLEAITRSVRTFAEGGRR